jgi:glutathionylspermidine synthase
MTSSITSQRNPTGPFVRDAQAHDLRAERPVDAETRSALRRRALLDGCKWDPQVGDVDTLASFPLVMKSSTWKRIASQAEQLTAEAIAAEDEISRRPELLNMLGLPHSLCRVLAEKTPTTPAAGRVMRFDFHYTTQGWRISEANSDVPGGFSEASCFTTLIAEHFPNLRPAGNPVEDWSNALATAASPSGAVALLSAPGFMEDYQVVTFLAARLRERGCRPHLAKPEQIHWRDGIAQLNTVWHRGPLDAIVRFYQAEWLSRLPENIGWKHIFRGGRTRVANPALAVISESKRFPLTWERLSAALPTWRDLLPETRDPRNAAWSRDDG